jgi:hypothetical protein
VALLWKFRFYVSGRGQDEIMAWYTAQAAPVRAKFLSRLRTLGQQTRAEWRRPLFGVLYDECEGLWEIIFEAAGVPHRPLGFFLDDETFAIVLCASKDGLRWIPKGACQTGLRRKAEIIEDAERSSCKCPLPLE